MALSLRFLVVSAVVASSALLVVSDVRLRASDWHGYPSVKECNVRDYGAVPDGRTVNTKMIQAAIDDCASASADDHSVKARVVLDGQGTFVSGAIFLKSRLTFYVADGTTLQGVWAGWDNTWTHYPKVYSRGAGTMMEKHASLVNGAVCTEMSDTPTAFGDQCKVWGKLEKVVVEGKGTIDGNGFQWWNCKSKTTCPDGSLFASQRPTNLGLLWIEDLIIRDLTIRNGAFWNVHPTFCNKVVIDGLTILSPTDSPNTDGIDPDSSSNIHISNCYIDGGDDCFAIKSGKDLDGRLVNIPTKNVKVTDCTCMHGHGLSIGSEMSGNVENVVFRNIYLNGTDTGPRIKSERGRGGLVKNIVYDNITLDNYAKHAVELTLLYSGGRPPTNATATPRFDRISFRHLRATPGVTASKAGVLNGLKESLITNVNFTDVLIDAPSGFDCNGYMTLSDVIDAKPDPTHCAHSFSSPDLDSRSEAEVMDDADANPASRGGSWRQSGVYLSRVDIM